MIDCRINHYILRLRDKKGQSNLNHVKKLVKRHVSSYAGPSEWSNEKNSGFVLQLILYLCVLYDEG